MATAAKKKEEKKSIEITPVKRELFTVRVVGDSPLIVHAWSEKAKRMMLEAQTGKKTAMKKVVRRPVDDFIQAAYWLTQKPVYGDDATDEEIGDLFAQALEDGARFGFPVTAFKQAATASAYRMGWIDNQMGARGAFNIRGNEENLVEIHSDPPVMREDMVKVGKGTADLRYRPEYRNWHADLTIEYNTASAFSWKNLLDMLNAAGFVCGVGEWRPERDGNFGMFHVESV